MLKVVKFQTSNFMTCSFTNSNHFPTVIFVICFSVVDFKVLSFQTSEHIFIFIGPCCTNCAKSSECSQRMPIMLLF